MTGTVSHGTSETVVVQLGEEKVGGKTGIIVWMIGNVLFSGPEKFQRYPS